MKTALLVLDIQEYFLRGAPDTLVDEIAEECKKPYDVTVFTIFRNTANSNFVKSLGWNKCSKKKDINLPPVLTQYTSSKNIFERTAYSALHSIELRNYLTKNKIEKVVLCGIDTDACLLATAFNAFDDGYRVEVRLGLTFSTGQLQEASRILMRNIVWRLDR